jgi:hypothetical protein
VIRKPMSSKEEKPDLMQDDVRTQVLEDDTNGTEHDAKKPTKAFVLKGLPVPKGQVTAHTTTEAVDGA